MSHRTESPTESPERFIPTHIYDGVPVVLDSISKRYRRRDGSAVGSRGWQPEKLLPAKGHISFRRSLVTLVLRAADPNPGRGIMPGYATDMYGNLATLISPGVVKLSLMKRNGDSEHFLIDLPESIDLPVTALEMPNDE